MRTLVLFVLSLMLVPTAYAGEHGDVSLITKPSVHSVSKTIDRLEKIVKSKGINVVARVRHSKAAKKAGLKLRPTELLIFGNPKLGTPMMQSNQLIGLDLPLKVLAWKDRDGKVWVSYTDPAALAARYQIDDKDEIIKKMQGALAGMTDQAAGPDKLKLKE